MQFLHLNFSAIVQQINSFDDADTCIPESRVLPIINLVITAAVLVALWQFRKAIMANQAELAQSLRTLTAQNEKAATEQAAALQKLLDALDAGGGTTPEVDAAVEELRASIQRDDDVNPDAVEPAPI